MKRFRVRVTETREFEAVVPSPDADAAKASASEVIEAAHPGDIVHREIFVEEAK